MKPLVILIALVLAGCCTDPKTITVVQEVKVPVPVKCKVTLPPKPEPIITTLPTTGLYDRGIALMREHEAYRQYAREMEAAVTACVE